MKNEKQKKNIPVVILCGGLGTRLVEETETKPKPMVEIGGKPILWHIMKMYSSYGFNRFVLCLGYKGEAICDYFLNYEYHKQDLRLRLGENNTKRLEVLSAREKTENWDITLAHTGASAMTGARVKRIEQYIDTDHFMLTYGDGVSDVDIGKLYNYHMEHGKVGTVTGVRPPSRFGELDIKESKGGYEVGSFLEKPPSSHKGSIQGQINGGFFVLSKDFFKYVKSSDDCILEKAPLEKLAKDKQLMMFQHQGFWQCMDTMRDLQYLKQLWDTGKAPWAK